jgi:hypothetical protein
MNRRDFIYTSSMASAVALAGCPMNEDDSEDSTPEDQNSADESDTEPEPDPEAVVKLNDMDPIKPFEYDVTVLSDSTEDSPLTLEIQLTNTGDETYEYGERRDAMFWLTEEVSGYTTYPRDKTEDLTERNENGWYLTEAPVASTEFQIETIDPDESHTEEVIVAHTPTDTPEEIPTIPNAVQVETEFDIVTEEEAQQDFSATETVSWGFTIFPTGEIVDTTPDITETKANIQPDPMEGLNPLEYTVTVVSEATQKQPLILDVEITNTGEKVMYYGERRDALFWNTPDDGENFYVYPKQIVSDLTVKNEPVWQLSEAIFITEELQVAKINPDETHSQELYVLHSPGDEITELPEELYFETNFRYSESESEILDNGGNGASWGFTVNTNPIENPEPDNEDEEDDSKEDDGIDLFG